MESLAAADGAQDYTILIAIDGYNKPNPDAIATASTPAATGENNKFQGFKYLPSYKKYSKLIETAQQYEEISRLTGYPFHKVEIKIANENLGYPKNKLRALTWAFEYSDYIIFVEDDIMFYPDALRWFEAHYKSGLIHNSPEIAFISCFGYSFPSTLKEYDITTHMLDLYLVDELGILDAYHKHNWHTPWGWATWRSVWDNLQLKNWTGNAINLGNLVRERNLYEILPLVARCNNIGSEGVNMGKSTSVVHFRHTHSGHYPISRLNNCRYRYLSGPFSQLRLGISYKEYPENTTFQSIHAKIPQDQLETAKLRSC